MTGQIDKAMYHGKIDTSYDLFKLSTLFDDESTRIRIEQQARSVACIVEKALLIDPTNQGSTKYRISPHAHTLALELKKGYLRANHTEQKRPYPEEETKINCEVPFQDQLTLGNGTAFLVGKQLVLTAAHCICDQTSGLVSRVKLVSLRVIFGFQIQSAGQTQIEFEPKDVYRVNDYRYRYVPKEADWALLKLDREVEGREPLNLAVPQEVSSKTSLYMLGHLSGLPLKTEKR